MFHVILFFSLQFKFIVLRCLCFQFLVFLLMESSKSDLLCLLIMCNSRNTFIKVVHVAKENMN